MREGGLSAVWFSTDLRGWERPSERLWELGRARLPRGGLPAQPHGPGPVPHGLARGLSPLPGSWGSLAL